MKHLIIGAFLILVFPTCRQRDASFSKKAPFEKIIFHTSMCFGTCPTYHLEVDSNRRIELFAEMVYKDGEEEWQEDTSKIGYFTGIVSDSTFNALSNAIKTVGIDTIKFNNITCCDGSLITIIAYHHGKRKYLQSMFPPNTARPLISVLYGICRQPNLARTKNELGIEQPESPKLHIIFPPPVKN